MADSSLDDFFAKKDKSKKKSKSKTTPGDSLAKTEELKKVKKKKEKEQPGGLGLNTAEDTAKKAKEDDEWEDFVEQKEVDYTGLRIQTLQVKEEEEKEGAESEGEGEGGEKEEGRETVSGPWNASGAGPPVPPVVATPVAPPSPSVEPEEKKESTGPKKYVPPAQRNAALSGASTASSNPIARRVSNKKAPNIQSEEDFPTLGGAPAATTGFAWGNRRYENSGAGDIESNPGSRRGTNLTLENKFAALQD